MAKQPSQRDRPLLVKLFKGLHSERRKHIATYPNHDVQTIVEDIPLLGDMYFVSIPGTHVYFILQSCLLTIFITVSYTHLTLPTNREV